MKTITTRYGASVPLTVTIDDDEATTATIFIGMEGETPLIEKTAAFIDKVADVSLEPEDTEIPLDDYKYQINIEYSDGRLDKLPDSDCDDGLPTFIVLEALDVEENS